MKATIADQDRVTRRYARYAEISVRDVLGSMRPHTYGVRPLPCPSVATEPSRPTACIRECKGAPNGGRV